MLEERGIFSQHDYGIFTDVNWRHHEHFIVAYNWDEAGRNRIERIAAKLGGWVYYLGGLAEGQDPYDMLKPVVNAISGFSLKHLKPMRNATAGDRT